MEKIGNNYQQKIKIIEQKIYLLNKNLMKLEREKVEIKLLEFKDEFAENFDEFSREEMELIYQLLFGHYILENFEKTCVIEKNIYINRVSEFLGLYMEEVEEKFKELFDKFEEYEKCMSDEEIMEKLHFYVENAIHLQDDDIEKLSNIFIN